MGWDGMGTFSREEQEWGEEPLVGKLAAFSAKPTSADFSWWGGRCALTLLLARVLRSLDSLNLRPLKEAIFEFYILKNSSRNQNGWIKSVKKQMFSLSYKPVCIDKYFGCNLHGRADLAPKGVNRASLGGLTGLQHVIT